MTANKRQILSSIRNTKGQSMVEYTFILGFIALAVILSLTQLGAALFDKLTEFAVLVRG